MDLAKNYREKPSKILEFRSYSIHQQTDPNHFSFRFLSWNSNYLTSAPMGHIGVKTGAVKHNIQNRSNRIFSVPNLDFSKYLNDGGKAKLEERIQILLTLLYQEEQFKDDKASNLKNWNPLTQESDNNKIKRGGTIDELAEFVGAFNLNQSEIS